VDIPDALSPPHAIMTWASPGTGVTAAAGHSLPAGHFKPKISKTYFCT
jgi:hypothetical protein